MAEAADGKGSSTGETAASSAPPRPVGIHLERNLKLIIRWNDGRESHYPLAYLRSKCPCATCRNAEPAATHEIHAPAPGGSAEESASPRNVSLSILPTNFDRRAMATGASLVGSYALQITWADGHSTGIYDFGYLRSIDPMGSGAGIQR